MENLSLLSTKICCMNSGTQFKTTEIRKLSSINYSIDKDQRHRIYALFYHVPLARTHNKIIVDLFD